MTDREAKRFYDSNAWTLTRDKILRRDHYECCECRRRIERANEAGEILPAHLRHINRAECVHHIKHLKDYPDLRLDENNLESLCHYCHDLMHGRSGTALYPHRFKTNKQVITREQW